MPKQKTTAKLREREAKLMQDLLDVMFAALADGLNVGEIVGVQHVAAHCFLAAHQVDAKEPTHDH